MRGLATELIHAGEDDRGLKALSRPGARHNANAQAVAEGLAGDRRVSRVYYPGLASHFDPEVAKRHMLGFGGMDCFDIDGRYDRAAALCNRLTLNKRAASLGGVERFISLPVLTSQRGSGATSSHTRV